MIRVFAADRIDDHLIANQSQGIQFLHMEYC
jgi:hypothetical protein